MHGGCRRVAKIPAAIGEVTATARPVRWLALWSIDGSSVERHREDRCDECSGIAQELYAIRSQIASLKLRESELVDRLAAEMTEDRLELEGVGVFERRRKADRKAWDHEAVRSALLRRVRTMEPEKSVDLATGEVTLEDPTEQAFRVIFECARPDWRIRSLRSYDISADEFCQTTYGGYSIQFVGALEVTDGV